MAETAEERLAKLLLSGVEHLRSGRLEEGVRQLRQVAEAPELVAAVDLSDVRARALAMLGDALLQLDRPDEAAGAVQEALRLVPDGDPGRPAVQALWARVLDARHEAQQAVYRQRAAENLRKLDASDLRDRFEGLGLADALVKKANAELDVGDHELGASLANEALGLAHSEGGVREVVYARLSLARAEPSRAREHLVAAWECAERANEFTLVGAVARAADTQQVALPVQVGPDLGRVARNNPTENNDPGDPMG